VFKVGDRKYELCNTDDRFGSIHITLGNAPIDSLPSSKILDPAENDGVGALFTYNTDARIHDLMRDLRTIEGSLTLWGVETIDLNSLEQEWIAENSDEEGLVPEGKLSVSFTPPLVAPAQADLIVRSILATESLLEFEVPLNFYRQGNRELREQRFVSAFHNFFFCLETQFGGGQFKKNQLAANFLSSDALTSAIGRAQLLGAFIGQGKSFQSELKTRYLEADPGKLIETLIDIRGELHHHTKRKRRTWNPGVQRDYEMDALFIQLVCHEAITTPVTEVLFRDAEIDRFKNTPVTTSSGTRINWKLDTAATGETE